MALDQREEEGLQARGRLHEVTLARWSERSLAPHS
jgi:hypothetical protein